MSRGSYDAALHAAGGACAMVDELLAGARAVRASAACARRATTPSARPRWASASSTTSRSRRSTRSTHGAERVLVLDWDVHHGNGTNDIFHSRDDVLFASIHQSPLYPGTGPLQRRRLGPRARASR